MSEEPEIWASCPIHPLFEASNLGRVRNPDRTVVFSRDGKERQCRIRGRVLSPWLARNGYLHVSLQEGGKRTKFLVHRLVCIAFNGGFEAGHTVNHINGVKTDNRASNLEWVTLAQNTALEWATGLVDIRGERHPLSKLSNAQTAEILARRQSGERAADMAKEYGVSIDLIYKITQGRKPIIKPQTPL